jgi:hypothetical protein
MALENPPWLTQRNGELRLASDGITWFVVLDGQPHYSLTPVPVQGKYGCAIKQVNNGHPIESKDVYSTAAEALRGGLEDLRQALGW